VYNDLHSILKKKAPPTWLRDFQVSMRPYAVVWLFFLVSNLGAATASTVNGDGHLQSWSELSKAVAAISPLFKSVTLVLSPSFAMVGYDDNTSFINVSIATMLTIEGNGAIFDAAGMGGFFSIGSFYSSGSTTLILKNITMRNSNGAISISPFLNSLELNNCTLLNNNAGPSPPNTYPPGAIDVGAGSSALIKGCSFVPPISGGHNDICKDDSYSTPYATVTFACAEGQTGTPVSPKPSNVGGCTTDIPPVELLCH
jgi:hypothetical protein